MGDDDSNAGGMIRTICPGGRWGAVPESLVEDTRLSVGARLVAVWLAMRPVGWRIVIAAMRQRLAIGRDRWLGIARELEGAGYLSRAKMPGPTRGRIVWDIVFNPVPQAPQVTSTSSAPPKPAMTADVDVVSPESVDTTMLSDGKYDLETLIDATIRARARDDPPKSPRGWAHWARRKAAEGDWSPLAPGRQLLDAEAQRADAEARIAAALTPTQLDDPEALERGKAIWDRVRRRKPDHPVDTG